jgi:hypothetical protein
MAAGGSKTHLEFLVSLQDLRAQREVMYGAIVVVVNDGGVLDALAFAAFILILSFVCWGWRSWRLCQFYTLFSKKGGPV